MQPLTASAGRACAVAGSCGSGQKRAVRPAAAAAPLPPGRGRRAAPAGPAAAACSCRLRQQLDPERHPWARARAAAQEEQQAGGGAEGASASVLQQLLVWLVRNGVLGVGMDDSRIGVYADADGDRGVVAVQDIAAGEAIAHVPLRLAITDVLDESERAQLVGHGALWQDRLVAKLLTQVQLGPKSPWAPYLQALPRSVPSALECFSAEEAAEVQLPAAVAAIRAHPGKMRASWQACRPDAIGGADLQTYRWAHSVVMSRTFGNASPSGGVGVRMLVPLVDLINHAGDETPSGLLADEAVAQDNVRWDVVSPERGATGEWEMALSATRDVAAGEPLLLSYFEGDNSELLLHYGFVPPSNPHDTVELYPGVAAALEHLWRADAAAGKDRRRLAPLYSAALDAGAEALQAEVAAAAEGAGDGAALGRLFEALEPVKVASGSRVSGSLVAALEVLHGSDMAAVEAAVAAIAWARLQALPTSLLDDLATLVAHSEAAGDGEAVRRYGGLLRHYAAGLVPRYAPELHAPLRAALAAGAGSGGGRPGAVAAVGLPARKAKAVPGPPKPPALASGPAQQLEQQQEHEQQQPDGGGVTAQAIQRLPLGVLVEAVSAAQQQQQQQQQQHLPLSIAVRMAVAFRASKKQLLWDVVLAARAPLAELRRAAAAEASQADLTAEQQQQQQQQQQGNGGSAAGPSLPWQSFAGSGGS